MRVLRSLYTLLVGLALPLILLRLFWRSLKQPSYRQHLGERFGWGAKNTPRGVIWIHAVSVGETRGAAPLIEALLARYPQQPILLTCMTPTSRQTAKELFGDRVLLAYLPYDFPIALKQFFTRYAPCCALFIETEIWFNAFAACRARSIPALLVNARMSEKSATGYHRWKPIRMLTREALAGLDHVAAQSAADAERLAQLGAASVSITGNLKFDVKPDQTLIALGTDWRASVGTKHILLAASTRDGEEALLLEAYCQAFGKAARSKIVLVVVPRHPQRFDAVHALIEKAGLRVQRRSQSTAPGHDCEVWLGDSMGEMTAYTTLCDLAFIGGSLLPLGGQNLIEACALGKPVLIGPSRFNFAEAAAQAEAADALRSVPDAPALMRVAVQLFDDDTTRLHMAECARTFAAAHRGATAKTMALIEPFLRTHH